MTRVVNALSVDVEDYFQVSAFSDVVSFESWEGYDRRVESNTRRMVDLFDHAGVKATFFVLGWIAERHPELVRHLHARGHEVASHGYAHRTLERFSPREFRDEVRAQRAVLEDLTGAAVLGYRAPSFSITHATCWALEVLLEEGFRYDSSIFPIRHDRYGIPSAPRFPHAIPFGGRSLLEFPMSTVRAWGAFNLPMGGGGYFRLFPYRVTSWGIRRINRIERQPAMVYLHPWEIDPDQPRLSGRALARWRHTVNLDKTQARLLALLAEFQFAPVREVLGLRDDAPTPIAVSAGAVSS